MSSKLVEYVKTYFISSDDMVSKKKIYKNASVLIVTHTVDMAPVELSKICNTWTWLDLRWSNNSNPKSETPTFFWTDVLCYPGFYKVITTGQRYVQKSFITDVACRANFSII